MNQEISVATLLDHSTDDRLRSRAPPTETMPSHHPCFVSPISIVNSRYKRNSRRPRAWSFRSGLPWLLMLQSATRLRIPSSW
jgi:hypothetical protein